jgi:eukaryotic-like serine/threonine-protein kinase
LPLQAGAHVGPYEILSAIGAGGMGEVWKARDTRLDRIVAIKTIHGTFSERFEREARAISALNHPHICALYDVGEHDGAGYLVMEYVEGSPLKGPLPLDHALKYGAQICDALDAAHRKGIVHRDLKPDNILLTKAGVKLLDFGLAKDVGPAKVGPHVLREDAELAATKALTGAHVILGTPQYMAPEQIEGRDADARTDLFAFGCVLYELLTGQKAFDGKTPSSTMAAILATEPRPLRELQPVTAPALERIVKRCLAKDPDDRWQTARDLRAELEWMGGRGADGEDRATAAARATKSSPLWKAAAGGLATLSLGLMAALWAPWRPPPETPPTVFEIYPPAGETLSDSPAVSPDGRSIASTSTDQAGRRSLIIRRLDSLSVRKLAATDGANAPSWSPDGRYLIFAQAREGKLEKIDVAGGPPQILCDFPDDRIPFTAISRDGVILFTGPDGGLWRVSLSGGVPERVTTVDTSRQETRHSHPQFLPDGRRFIYLAESAQPEKSAMFVASLASNDRTLVLAGRRAAFLTRTPRGAAFLVFEQGGSLVARSFDDRNLTVNGDSFLIAERVASNPAHPFVGVSDAGVLAYHTSGVGGGANGLPERQLAWFDRAGKHLADISTPGRFFGVSLAPDDSHVAVSRLDNGNFDIWALDLAGTNPEVRLTFDAAREDYPIWSPDGRVVFSTNRSGARAIFAKPANGLGAEQLQSKSEGIPVDWSPDGRHLLVRSGNTLMVETEGRAAPFAQTALNPRHAQFSPDGNWIAYASDESKRPEVYVASFPSGGSKFQISIAGGAQPRWRRDGKELFYVALDGMLMALPVDLRAGFSFRAPTALFKPEAVRDIPVAQYSVVANGQRFLVSTSLGQTSGEPSVSPITVVTNWLSLRK